MSVNLALHHYLFEHEVLFRLPGENLPIASAPDAEFTQDSGQVASIPEVVDPSESAIQSPFYGLRSRVLILVQTYGQGVKPEERAFLAKVLKAVNHDIDKVDLLELDKLSSQDASVVMKERLADYVLLFGVKPEMANLDVQLNLFEPVQYNGIWFLMSNSLLRIEMQESKRRDLWNALKKIFF